MEVIEVKEPKRKSNEGKYTQPLPAELQERSQKYAVKTVNAMLKCDEADIEEQLQIYATTPTYHLENIAQFFHVGVSTLQMLFSSEKYKPLYGAAKKARAQKMLESGLDDIIETHEKIVRNEEVHPALVKSTEVLSKYKMRYATMLDHDLTGRNNSSSDTNIQINVQTPFEVKDL